MILRLETRQLNHFGSSEAVRVHISKTAIYPTQKSIFIENNSIV